MPDKEGPPSPVKKEDRRIEEDGQLIFCGSDTKLFRIECLIGSGTMTDVYRVHRTINTDEKRALKIERFDSVPIKERRLRNEQAVFDFIQGDEEDAVDKSHFPKMWICAKTSLYVFYIMELLGPPLDDLHRKMMKGRTKPRTIAEIGRQTLMAIEALHGLGWLHRAIKPHNFHVGVKEKEKTIFLLGFNFARQFKETEGKVSRSRRMFRGRGGARYASARAMKFEDQSRRDDIESWCYMMLEYYYQRNLIWAVHDFAKGFVIGFKERVMGDPIKMKNKGQLRMPARFSDILSMTNKLKLEDVPDYSGMMKILEEIIKDERIDMTLPLDWIGREWPLSRTRKKKRDEESGESVSEPDEREARQKKLKERRQKLEQEMVEIYRKEGTIKTLEDVQEEMRVKDRRLRRKMSDILERSIVDDDDDINSETADANFKRRTRKRTDRAVQPRKKRSDNATEDTTKKLAMEAARRNEPRKRCKSEAEERDVDEDLRKKWSTLEDKREERQAQSPLPRDGIRRKPAKGINHSKIEAEKARRKSPGKSPEKVGKDNKQTAKETKPEDKKVESPGQRMPLVKELKNGKSMMGSTIEPPSKTDVETKEVSVEQKTDKCPVGLKPSPAAIAKAADRDELGVKRLTNAVEAAKKEELDKNKNVFHI